MGVFQCLWVYILLHVPIPARYEPALVLQCIHQRYTKVSKESSGFKGLIKCMYFIYIFPFRPLLKY